MKNSVDYKKNDDINYKEEIKKLLEKAREPYTFKRVYKLLEYLYIQEATEGKMNYYKTEIINLVQNYDNSHWLKVIYAYVKALLG